MCSGKIKDKGGFLCSSCLDYVEVDVVDISNADAGIVEIKSKCCKANVFQHVRVTCSDECHEELVKQLEEKFGKYKKVTDEGGKSYRVPTRDIIERGLKYEDLSNYEMWED